MTDPAVLVVTCLTDVTADLVITALNERGARVVRLDPADALNGELEFSVSIGGAEGWRGTVSTPTRHVGVEEVATVYYRRPSAWESTHPDSQVRRFVQTEARHGLGGLLHDLPDAAYVNHPAAVSRAEYKPGQLQAAARAGFSVPPTLITNDPEPAREFAAKHAPVVYKPMRGLPAAEDGTAGAIWAQRIAPSAIDASVSATAHMFQAEVPKTADARVTVVGGRVFASAITAPGQVLDWRRTDWESLHHEPLAVPGQVAGMMRAYLEACGLVFGCFDFALTGSGDDPADWVWMECNPNGQWGWLPDAEDIAVAFADVLTDPAARSRR